MQVSGNNGYNMQSAQQRQQPHSTIGEKVCAVARDVGGAFLDGAVSVAKDAAKEEGKKLAGQAIELAGSIFTK